MKRKKGISVSYFVIVFLLFIQTATYLTLGSKLMKLQLLPDYLINLSHETDSLYVKDFCSSCPKDAKNYFSNNLKKDEQLLKKKFKVKHIEFEEAEKYKTSDFNSIKYNLFYEAYATRNTWYTLFGLYSARQTEILVIDRKFIYTRETKHQWFLFFWIKTSENFSIDKIEK